MKVGIIGGSGYVGGELIRILLSHPSLESLSVTSRKYAGQYLYRVHPNLRKITDIKFEEQDFENIVSKSDIVFTSVPHGSAVNFMPRLIDSGIKVVDMSADFRLKKSSDYPQFYDYIHPNPEILDLFTFGLPEIKRIQVMKSRLVSCPGCMALTSIIALAPLVKEGVIENEKIIIDSKIGSSGGGAEPSKSTHHAERYGVIRPYKPIGHRHTAEIEQELSELSNQPVNIHLSTHAVNIVRGILCTIHAFSKETLKTSDLWRIYRRLYGDEPFIRIVRDKQGIYRFPDPKVVIGSNFCDIGFEVDTRSNRIVIMAATDNLIKGAAGNGIQCMNLMMGLKEETGLWIAGIHPV